ncbi:MAG: phosphate ABC transporter substrate-binding protein [Spirochaetales bacterium]|uniref:Phosphate ABC transporter substrate-binding protein n=1 Tax=Candidatus Thalassospirochaeta sargassi TaxID=3119039 RepID=A0AAJ1IGG8_9SPIO|nr:phosphate ABC transporter substrate-binding protein [Spirochaetales bacterium]
MKKIIAIMIVLSVMTAVFVFAGGQQEVKVDSYAMGGSTTLEPIIRSAIEAYEDIHADVRLSYEAQGSSVGVQGAIDEVYVLGGASRELKGDEPANGAVATPIALDGIAVVANNSVLVDNLTKEQVAGIYKGDITNWSEVGGADKDIIVINRDEASGTRVAFWELTIKSVYDKTTEFIKDAITVESNGDMVTKVGSTPDSIGYCGFGYLDKAVSSGAKTLLVNGIEASVDNVLKGEFPISRKLNVITKDEPTGFAAEFIEFLLSDEGQTIVDDEGFISLP